MSRRAMAAVLAGTLIAFASAAGRAADPTPAELAAALQRKYDSVKDFSTDFQHVYTGGVLKKQITERGTLVIKKPGKMRWEYTAPEHKTFVSDGAKMYLYIPADKQVIVGSVPADDTASSPALFLTGKGNLTRDFTASAAEPPAAMPAGTRALKLVPKTAQPDYDWLIVSIDPATLSLRGLVALDAQGGTSSFAFTNLKENVGVADAAFAFKIPRGADVVTDAPAR